VSAPGIIVVPSAKQHPVFAIRPDGMGDITNAADKKLWSWKRTPDVPTPVIFDGLVYLCMENGNVTVLEAMTGKEVYSQATHRQRHRASPVFADGKLYLTARDGRVTVVQAGREFKSLAVNELGEDQCELSNTCGPFGSSDGSLRIHALVDLISRNALASGFFCKYKADLTGD
jgi:hypothetical protein